MPRSISVCLLTSIMASAALASTEQVTAPRPKEAKFIVQPTSRHTQLSPAQLEGDGARVLVTYTASTHAVAVPQPAREQFMRRMADKALELRELEDVIQTPGHTIDSHVDVPPPAPPGPGLFVVQYTAPAVAAWQAAVRQSGVVPIQPLPERATIVVATPDQIAALARLPWIQYVGPYIRDYKFSPAGRDTGEFVIQIADTEASTLDIAAVDDLVDGFLTRTSSDNILTARIRTSRLIAETLLDQRFVLGVETFIEPQPSDERQVLSLTGASTLAGAVSIANSGSATGTNYRKWLNKYGFTPAALTNSNIVVDIADTGVDNGCFSGTGSIRSHKDLSGRVVYQNGATLPSGAEQGAPSYIDSQGHGTTVAGIVAGIPENAGSAGSGISISGSATNGYAERDSGQFYYGMGVAPGIRIGSTVMMGSTTGQVGSVNDWTNRAVTRNCALATDACATTSTLCAATVQNHSNNEYEETGGHAGYYTISAHLFDKSVRRADHVSISKPLAITVAAGNIGQFATDPSTTVLAPATAKNVISVGGVESSRDAIPAACLTDPRGGDNQSVRHLAGGYSVLAYGSRRGTRDNRMKPDLLAPSTLVTGPRSSYGGTWCMTGTLGDGSGKYYHGTSGTSFAAPVAAGSIALLRYFYSTKYGLTPSPAMYKAMLVAGARSITGGIDRYETYKQQTTKTVTSWPNAQQGFGAIALENLFNAGVARAWSDQKPAPLLQSESAYFTVQVTNPAQPVKIVLAWTDAPGTPQTVGDPLVKAIVNDLDLRATWPDGVQYYGNVMNSSGYSYVSGCARLACGSPADVLNNVEVLNVDPARFATGNQQFTVRVWAANLNGPGVPGAAAGANNQDFALFVVNGSLTPQ